MKESELTAAFAKVLNLFPELSRFKIKLRFFISKPGFPQGKVIREGTEYVVYLAINLIRDYIEAEFVIAHELAHILINPKRIPSIKENIPEDPTELLDIALEDVICDWIALKRLEETYVNDKKKLIKLYEKYLEKVGPEGNVSIAEEMRERVIAILNNEYKEALQYILRKYFLELSLNSLKEFAVLAIAKYLKIR